MDAIEDVGNSVAGEIRLKPLLDVQEHAVEAAVDVAADGALRVRVLVEVEERLAAPRLDGAVDIEERDGRERPKEPDAAGTALRLDEPRTAQLQHDAADDDGIRADAARKELARDAVAFTEIGNGGEEMDGNRELRGNLHGGSSFTGIGVLGKVSSAASLAESPRI